MDQREQRELGEFFQHVHFDNYMPASLWILGVLVQWVLNYINIRLISSGEQSVSWFAGIGGISVAGTLSFRVRWGHTAYRIGGGVFSILGFQEN